MEDKKNIQQIVNDMIKGDGAKVLDSGTTEEVITRHQEIIDDLRESLNDEDNNLETTYTVRVLGAKGEIITLTGNKGIMDLIEDEDCK